MAAYGKKKQEVNVEYEKLREDLKNRTPGRVYAFYGEERYLLEDAVRKLRDMIPSGTEEFNHHRLEGKGLRMDDLAEAVDAMPAFSQLTLTEVTDLDLSKLGESDRGELLRILSDIPEYVTVVFIFDSVEYKLDGRTKAGQAMKKLIRAVEFKPQSEAALSTWIVRHFSSRKMRITREALERLITMTGGLMTNIRTEVEKLAAYAVDTVDVQDVEAVVVPVPEAAAWELTDAIVAGKNDLAMEKLSELMLMNVDAHKIIYSVTLTLRRLLTACVLSERGGSARQLMDIADIQYEFQARSLLGAARKLSVDRCKKLCEISAGAAYKLNSSRREDRELMTDLVIRLMAS